MNNDLAIKIFRSVLKKSAGTTRGMNDEGNECSKVFILDQSMIEEIAEKLAQWWNDTYGTDGTELTSESATDFLEEIYPETDETTKRCN